VLLGVTTVFRAMRGGAPGRASPAKLLPRGRPGGRWASLAGVRRGRQTGIQYMKQVEWADGFTSPSLHTPRAGRGLHAGAMKESMRIPGEGHESSRSASSRTVAALCLDFRTRPSPRRIRADIRAHGADRSIGATPTARKRPGNRSGNIKFERRKKPRRKCSSPECPCFVCARSIRRRI